MFNLNFFIDIYTKDNNEFSSNNIDLSLEDHSGFESDKSIGDHIIYFLSQQDKPRMNIKNKINIKKVIEETDLVYIGYDKFLEGVDDHSVLYYFLNDTEHLSLFFYLFEKVFCYQNITLPNTQLYLQYLFRTPNVGIAYQIYIYFLFYFGRYNIIKNINNFYLENLSKYSMYEIVLDMISCESFNYKNNIEDVLKIIGSKNELVNKIDTNDIFLYFINRLSKENKKIVNKVVDFLYEMNFNINDNIFSYILKSEKIDCNIKRLIEYKEIGF
jgi:hypothetical protein